MAAFITLVIFSVHLFKKIESYSAVLSSYDDNENDLKRIITIGSVACGKERIEQVVNMMNSAVIFSKVFINFNIFYDETEVLNGIRKCLHEWPKGILKGIRVNFYLISFPMDRTEEWKYMFKAKPCTTQRLFFPVFFPF